MYSYNNWNKYINFSVRGFNSRLRVKEQVYKPWEQWNDPVIKRKKPNIVPYGIEEDAEERDNQVMNKLNTKAEWNEHAS